MNPERSHILTVNLEDYFQVGAFNRFIQKNRWQRFESRIEVTTDRTLELLARHGAKATFFVLGWIADQFPAAIRRVAEAGHEVAVRGYYHRRVREMTPDEFRADTIRARNAVERASGRLVHGYRVADGWFGPNDLWALDVLAELGFAYDSSLAPMRGDFGDDPRRFATHEHPVPVGRILEVPISTGKILGMRVPIAGGNYLRQLPKPLLRGAVKSWAKHSPHPLVAYFHTWELDPEQPQMTGVGWFQKLRHYRNLKAMPARLGELLSLHRFGSVADFLSLNPDTAPDRGDIVPLVSEQSVRPMSANGPRKPVSIVVPCFNEELLIPHLKNTLDETKAKLEANYDLEFILVDDGSTDATWAKLHTNFGHRPDYHLHRHDVNLGVSAAILTGIRAAHTDTVCSMDSDGSYDPLKLAEMIPLLTQGVDLVTASPYHPAGGVKNVPNWRLALSRGCAWMYRRVLDTKLYTYTSCFRVYRRGTVAAIPVKNGRYLGIAELVGRLDLAQKKIVEFPTVLETRMIGRSKMKTVRTILGHLGLMVRLTFDRWKQSKSSDRDQVIRHQLNYLNEKVIPDLLSGPGRSISSDTDTSRTLPAVPDSTPAVSPAGIGR